MSAIKAADRAVLDAMQTMPMPVSSSQVSEVVGFCAAPSMTRLAGRGLIRKVARIESTWRYVL